jgi:hypothetical protein
MTQHPTPTEDRPAEGGGMRKAREVWPELTREEVEAGCDAYRADAIWAESLLVKLGVRFTDDAGQFRRWEDIERDPFGPPRADKWMRADEAKAERLFRQWESDVRQVEGEYTITPKDYYIAGYRDALNKRGGYQ